MESFPYRDTLGNRLLTMILSPQWIRRDRLWRGLAHLNTGLVFTARGLLVIILIGNIWLKYKVQ